MLYQRVPTRWGDDESDWRDTEKFILKYDSHTQLYFKRAERILCQSDNVAYISFYWTPVKDNAQQFTEDEYWVLHHECHPYKISHNLCF